MVEGEKLSKRASFGDNDEGVIRMMETTVKLLGDHPAPPAETMPTFTSLLAFTRYFSRALHGRLTYIDGPRHRRSRPRRAI